MPGLDHTSNRDKIVAGLRRELVGPAPQGKELDCAGRVRFATEAEARGPWRENGTGEEIISRDSPGKRYGIGVLYPWKVAAEVAGEDGDEATPEIDVIEDGAEFVSSDAAEDAAQAVEQDSDDYDLTMANAYQPSSMGVTLLAEFPVGSQLVVEVRGGCYRRLPVVIGDWERTWWVRQPVAFQETFTASALNTPRAQNVRGTQRLDHQSPTADVRIEVFSRPHIKGRLVTVCLVNRSAAGFPMDERCLFQSRFTVTVEAADGKRHILPYPDRPYRGNDVGTDDEEASLELLYRHMQTYAIGHGCAADWDHIVTGGQVATVSAECLPEHETRSITPDVRRADGTPITVSMAELAGLAGKDNGRAGLMDVIAAYEAWIAERRAEMAMLADRYHAAATRHLEECDRCARRMRDGLKYLEQSADAALAFQIANHAILLQQVRSGRGTRQVAWDEKQHRWHFTTPYSDPDLLTQGTGRGEWRAFQIAFLLMSIESAVEAEVKDRETVELIWFPTGGGKTEAYLGLSAFAIIMRRLKSGSDVGVHVLMRYTLRLLTAQQFQRAAGLLCAMEYLRLTHPQGVRLGRERFTIGIWVGNETTPGSRAQALSMLSDLQKSRRADNGFLLLRCPWCGAQMGPVRKASAGSGKSNSNTTRVAGYEQQGTSVIFACPDPACPFSGSLPVYVIDEDIYEYRPSLLIGTVDKFATLPWRPEARAIFGIGDDGERVCSPPGLIIQDELHLISGPLGSMAGLYEALIEELCTDRRGDGAIQPKIVCSTATIRRFAAQIHALFARKEAALFPPPGLGADDSFFARYATTEDGNPAPGRLYLGIHAPGLGSLQTAQVRTFAALLQEPIDLPAEERDPWWTLLLFYNSLRELGGALTLFQSDIPDFRTVLGDRAGIPMDRRRRATIVEELTGRLRNDEVPEMMEKLEVAYHESGPRAVDVCLATNIIEVGIDIDRLSLMAVVGQPKTTSQYIQVTGRVGRRWWERPGLIVTLYSASKPRDRSHFEQFRSYHERLYAQVEPTSVTPFSPPALTRALHALMAAWVRQRGDRVKTREPWPYPRLLIDTLYALLEKRVQEVDEAELVRFRETFERRAREWETREPTRWRHDNRNPTAVPLLVAAGSYLDAEEARRSWPTPQSMRNVDATCVTEIV